MISLYFTFWLFVIFFGLAGAMRGWAKELLVTFSVLLAIFIITILERFAPFLTNFADTTSVAVGIPLDFWLRSIIIILFTFFGYQTPRLSRFPAAKVTRERAQDVVLGVIIGGINGYMVIGSIWYFLHQIGYNLNPTILQHISPPNGGSEIGIKTLELIQALPPALLVVPWIYFIIAIAFAFVVIVFV